MIKRNPMIAERVERDGFAVVQDAVEPDLIDALIQAVDSATQADATSGRRSGYGTRNLFQQAPITQRLISHRRIAPLVESVLGEGAFAVRAILFDKLDGANWRVGWHQDQTIAIRQRAEAHGFGPTSIKEGVPHTRGSAGVLERMLAVRLHLDDCGPDNGPLRCVPGSHKLGRLEPDPSLTHRRRLGERACIVASGGVLLMRPLCLHASSPAKCPLHRRVIHLEFANVPLPPPLDWHEYYPIRV